MIDNKKEYILCAAIYYKSLQKYVHQPKNIDSGIVVCGRRHHNCFAILAELFPDLKYKGSCKQGFITSYDRFIDREEANSLAIKIGQVENCTEGDDLISEELY